MSLDEHRYELEKSRFSFEQEKFLFEKKKFWFGLFPTLLTILITMVGAVLAYRNYQTEREKERNQAFEHVIAGLVGSNCALRVAAFQEIGSYEDKYEKLIPVLLKILVDAKIQGDTTLEPQLGDAFRVIGKRMFAALAEQNLRAQRDSSADLLRATSWGMGELLKSRVPNEACLVDLKNVRIENLSLTNLSLRSMSLAGVKMAGINFAGTEFKDMDLSESRFDGCSFLGSRFTGKTLMKASRFEKCNFQDCFMDVVLMDSSFQDCNVLNMRVSNSANTGHDTFKNCIQNKTIKYEDFVR